MFVVYTRQSLSAGRLDRCIKQIRNFSGAVWREKKPRGRYYANGQSIGQAIKTGNDEWGG